MNAYKVLVAHEGNVAGVIIVRPTDDLRTLNLARRGYLRRVEVVEDVAGSGYLDGAGVPDGPDVESAEVLNVEGGPEPDLGTPGGPVRRKNSRGRGGKAGSSGQSADGSEESGAPVGVAEASGGSEAF